MKSRIDCASSANERFETTVRPLLLLAVLLLYTLVGAYVFHMIEAPHEQEQRTKVCYGLGKGLPIQHISRTPRQSKRCAIAMCTRFAMHEMTMRDWNYWLNIRERWEKCFVCACSPQQNTYRSRTSSTMTTMTRRTVIGMCGQLLNILFRFTQALVGEVA